MRRRDWEGRQERRRREFEGREMEENGMGGQGKEGEEKGRIVGEGLGKK